MKKIITLTLLILSIFPCTLFAMEKAKTKFRAKRTLAIAQQETVVPAAIANSIQKDDDTVTETPVTKKKKKTQEIPLTLPPSVSKPPATPAPTSNTSDSLSINIPNTS